jgi:hypothetical protein
MTLETPTARHADTAGQHRPGLGMSIDTPVLRLERKPSLRPWSPDIFDLRPTLRTLGRDS